MPKTCAYPGCRQPLLKYRTRPARYCSVACRAADFRLRQRLLTEAAVPELVEAVRALLQAWCTLDDAGTDQALEQLATHALVRYPWPPPAWVHVLAAACPGGRGSSSPAQGGSVLASAALGQGNISADIIDE
jgi:hypothetical protein